MIENKFALEQVLGCVLSGAVLGVLFLLLKICRHIFLLKKISVALLDILFCMAASLTVFLFALAIDFGRLRFLQIALQCIGFLSVRLTLDPLVEKICESVTKKLYKKILRARRKLRGIFMKKKRKGARKTKKKKKNTIFRKNVKNS